MRTLYFTLLCFLVLTVFNTLSSQSFQDTGSLVSNQKDCFTTVVEDVESCRKKGLYLSKIDKNKEFLWQKKSGNSNTEETSVFFSKKFTLDSISSISNSPCGETPTPLDLLPTTSSLPCGETGTATFDYDMY